MLKSKKLAMIILSLLSFAGIIRGQSNDDCILCHEDRDLTGERDGKTVSMFVDMRTYSGSAHKEVKCISCHNELENAEFPHNDQLKKVNCSQCHLGYQEQIADDVHQKLGVSLGNKKPTCKLCHGTHRIKSISSIKDRSKELCGKCHQEDILSSAYHFSSEVNESCIECHHATSHEKELEISVHARLECSNCHGYIVNHLEDHQENPEEVVSADCYLCHNEIAAEHKESIHGISLQEGMTESAHCWDCHGSHLITSTDSVNSPVAAKNLVQTCGKCHDDPSFSELHYSSVKQPGKMYSTSVHGELVQMGRLDAASCITCHGKHNIKNRIQDGSLISSVNISKVCGECHQEIAEEYERSIHWIAVKKGVSESPTCNDCHSEHAVHAINTLEKREEMKKIQEQTCLICHQSLLLSQRFGLEEESASNYQDSYHGLAVMRGDEDAAMCVDCHGVHQILPKYHAESTIHEDNVVATCEKCHPGAGETFSKSYSHVSMEDAQTRKIDRIVGTIYFWVIVIVIGGMLLHNLIIFIYDLRERKRELEKEVRIPRFTKNELIQHIILLVSFIILAITGFQLKYPDSWWSEGLTNLGLNEVNRQWTHRISAVIMIALSVYHVVYLIVTARGRYVIKSLFLKFSDIKEAVHNILYHLHLRKKHPEFENYNYIEKAEYWALIWGTIVMGLTGFILWFPTYVSDRAPEWVIKVSETVHFYEAVLASLAIIVWHWFFVMFRPREYPMSFTCVDGKMTIIHYKDEHKMSYMKVMAEWLKLKQDKITINQMSHFGRMFIKAVEKAGVDNDEFIQTEIEKDEDLRAYLRNEGLL
jgi:predicted CXXCH cytochrome family protein